MPDMPDILAKICAAKRDEIDELRAQRCDEIREAARAQTPPLGFRAALTAADTVALIAEVKKASPSAGVIRDDFDPVRIARAYEGGGAACISVLTDEPFFQGSPDYLVQVRDAVGIPLLRKDFILHEAQLLESRALGADAVLLIVAALERPLLEYLLDKVSLLGMTALVEVHDEDEMETAAEVGANLIGINNRDLRRFQVDLAVTERLAPLAPADAVLVAESGIKTPDDVARVKQFGAHAILVGETLMRADDVEAETRRFASI